MRVQKLSLVDFEAVETSELLEVKGGNNSGGGSPCGTRINAQGYEESPLPQTITFGSSSGSSSSSMGTTVVGAVANRIWKGITGVGGSFFSATALNNYGSPPNNIVWGECPDGTVVGFGGSGSYEPGYSEAGYVPFPSYAL